MYPHSGISRLPMATPSAHLGHDEAAEAAAMGATCGPATGVPHPRVTLLQERLREKQSLDIHGSWGQEAWLSGPPGDVRWLVGRREGAGSQAIAFTVF